MLQKVAGKLGRCRETIWQPVVILHVAGWSTTTHSVEGRSRYAAGRRFSQERIVFCYVQVQYWSIYFELVAVLLFTIYLVFAIRRYRLSPETELFCDIHLVLGSENFCRPLMHHDKRANVWLLGFILFFAARLLMYKYIPRRRRH